LLHKVGKKSLPVAGLPVASLSIPAYDNQTNNPSQLARQCQDVQRKKE
jgi:hypothetical protein